MIVCVHVDCFTVAKVPEACEFLSKCLPEKFQTTGGELSWYLRCSFEHYINEDVNSSQRALIESVASRYGIDAEWDLPASQSADLGPRRKDESVCDKPVLAAVSSLTWLSSTCLLYTSPSPRDS